MNRFALLSVVLMTIAMLFLGSQMKHFHTVKVDNVDQAVAFMSHN